VHVFVSVGGTANDTQETFVRAVEDRLRSEGMVPHTVGRNTFSADSPFKAVTDVMDKCAGVVVIALERLHFPAGTEKRGGDHAKPLADVKLSTAWNQIEAAIAYRRGVPLLVLVEEGLRTDGLLEKGFDWYVQTVKLEAASLHSAVFNGVLDDWKRKTLARPAVAAPAPTPTRPDPGQMTVGQLLGALKPAQLWAVLGALAGALAAAFALGAKFWVGR
jgi:hypothetical protein